MAEVHDADDELIDDLIEWNDDWDTMKAAPQHILREAFRQSASNLRSSQEELIEIMYAPEWMQPRGDMACDAVDAVQGEIINDIVFAAHQTPRLFSALVSKMWDRAPRRVLQAEDRMLWVWTTRDYRVFLVPDMSTSHLHNAIGFLRAHPQYAKYKSRCDILEQELVGRGETYVPRLTGPAATTRELAVRR